MEERICEIGPRPNHYATEPICSANFNYLLGCMTHTAIQRLVTIALWRRTQNSYFFTWPNTRVLDKIFNRVL